MPIPELPFGGVLGLLLDIIQSHIMVFWGEVLRGPQTHPLIEILVDNLYAPQPPLAKLYHQEYENCYADHHILDNRFQANIRALAHDINHHRCHADIYAQAHIRSFLLTQ